MEQSAVTGHTLLQAEFDNRYLSYGRWLVTIWLVVSVAGILLIPFWLIFSVWYGREFMARISAHLTTNALEIRKGVFNRAEATIPLNRITFRDAILRQRQQVLDAETHARPAGPQSTPPLEVATLLTENRDILARMESRGSYGTKEGYQHLVSMVAASLGTLG